MTKNVLVTGASRGIGRAIAQAFCEAGYAVCGTATTAGGAQAIQDWIDQAGWQGSGQQLDVTKPESIEQMLKMLAAENATPAILVNNAGITDDQLMVRMKEEDWSRVIDTNLTSAFRLSKALLRPMMKQRFGRIINISSIVAETGNPGQANYAAAKAGLQGYTRSLAKEVGSRGITVNCIAPGYINTEMTSDLPDDVKAEFLKNIPIGRLGEAKEVAHAAVFLAAEESAYITGQSLHINGGLMMT